MSGSFDGSLDAATRFCAVYGHPIKHSASPAMQNAGIAALGLNNVDQARLYHGTALEWLGLNKARFD